MFYSSFFRCLFVTVLWAFLGLSAQAIERSDSLQDESVQRQAQVRKRIVTRRYYGQRKRYESSGFRVQIYTGSNDRGSRLEAQVKAQKVQQKFPELSVYVHFVSPSWVCRVGDFVQRSDAQRYARRIRARKLCRESRVVTCKILRAD